MSDRKLPVYIILDTSGSMRGEPIHSVNVGMQAMLSALRQDPFALESVHLCIITFDNEARVFLPLTHLEQVSFSDLEVPSSGATFMGAALELLVECVDNEVKKSTVNNKGDWRPLLFIMTDGSPSDVHAYGNAVKAIKQRNFASILACAAGPKANHDYLLQLTQQVVTMETMDASAFLKLFKWVSSSVSVNSMSMGSTNQSALPPPPPEVHLVI